MDITDQLHSFVQQYKIYIDKIYRMEGITPQQACVLFAVPFDGISINELANELGLHISTMTRNIKRLEALDIVSREADDTDKRIAVIHISDNGKKLRDRIEQSYQSQLKIIIESGSIINPLEFANNIEALTWSIKKMSIVNE